MTGKFMGKRPSNDKSLQPREKMMLRVLEDFEILYRDLEPLRESVKGITYDNIEEQKIIVIKKFKEINTFIHEAHESLTQLKIHTFHPELIIALDQFEQGELELE